MPPVVDTNVLLRGRSAPFESAVTVKEVMEELKTDSAKLNFDREDISIREPRNESLEKVSKKSREINSPTSETDEKLLALALELDRKLITDDKALQNLALQMGVKFDSYLQEEIDRERKWKKVCGNCGKEVSDTECSRCGSNNIKRKPD